MEEEVAAADIRAPKRHRSIGVNEQQVPGGSDGGEEQGSLDDVDHISGLPDEVLGTIVSLLPTKDGARTQVLSCRWLPLWRSHMAPLNLVADCNLCNDQSRIAVVSKILSDHPGPCRHFSVHIISLCGFRSKVTDWSCSKTLTGLQELVVTNPHKKCYSLPRCVLTRFAPTLRMLMLSSCRPFRVRTALPSFPHLKQLILYNVGISEDSLQCMISSCTVLESVSLRSMIFRRLCIRSRSLWSINLHALHSKGGELVIEDAPSLERLLLDFPNDGPATIQVIWAPKLEILGFYSEGISTLQLGTILFQKMIAVSLTTKMHTMKILALDSMGAKLDAVVDFLKCFPRLEKLYVILHPQKNVHNPLKYDPLDPIECLELHLQKVVLKNYKDNMSLVDFAKFFILNAKVLKEMEIGVYGWTISEWMSDQRRQLQVEKRASRGARIELRVDTYARPTYHRHTLLDFSMADPFGKTLLSKMLSLDMARDRIFY